MDAVELKKYEFFAESITSFSHNIWPGHLELAQHRTEDVANLENHTTQMVLASFPSLCNFYRQFVLILARPAAPVKNKVRKDQPENFDPFGKKKNAIVVSLKEVLVSPPLLALSKF